MVDRVFIDNVTLFSSNTKLGEANRAELLAPGPNNPRNLRFTIENFRWSIPGKLPFTNYLQKPCVLKGTAAGAHFEQTAKLAGVSGETTVNLD
jgi:hypothetical protein